MQLWQNGWEILFWLSLPLIVLLILRILSVERKIKVCKRQIQKDLHFPGMEGIRHFLKPILKQLKIDTDDKHYENN